MNAPTFRAKLARAWLLFGSSGVSSEVLKALIAEVENTTGYARNDVRAKAKNWLIAHRSTLATKDILLAEMHFGYLLPAGWGS